MRRLTLRSELYAKVILALFTISLFFTTTGAQAQILPCTPPSGYDQGGLYPAGSVNDVVYYSSVAGTNLTMKVYTPPNYSPSKRYGVIYCYQGVSTDPGTIFADWCVGAGIVADNLIGQGKIKPVIIVALDDQYNGTYGSDVANMTIKDAIPFVDSHYSTYADANHRGVYGYSWGGGYAFNVGCGNLDVFHHISPSSAAPNKAGDDQLFPSGGAEAKQKVKTLLISCGDADWLGLYTSSLNCHNYCIANNIPHYWFSVPGGNHDAGSVWRPAMWNFLQLAEKNGISASPKPTVVNKIVARHSGKALCPILGQTGNGTQIQQWTYLGGTDQQFLISPDGGYFKIIGVQSGKAVEVSGGNTGNGSKVQLWDYYGFPWQKWSFTPTDSGYFELVPSHVTNSCLDVNGFSTDDGALVQLWDKWGGPNQQWSLEAVNYYSPILREVSPNIMAAGDSDGVIVLKGDKFTTNSQVLWNGTPLASTYVSAYRLTAVVPASLIATPGSVSITVTNPAVEPSVIQTISIVPLAIAGVDLPTNTVISGTKLTDPIVRLNATVNSPVTVSIASNNPAAVPATTATIRAGNNRTVFSIRTRTVTTSTSATITATLGTSSQSSTLGILP